MLRKDLFDKVAAVKEETKNALQEVYNELNNGQQKKLLKNENIKALFERYGVEV
jgi:hypothetical protein